METSLKQLINRIADTSAPEIVIGIVMNASPPEIVLKDDSNIILHTASLYIPGRCQPLLQGRELFLLSLRNQKMYYILDYVNEAYPQAEDTAF